MSWPISVWPALVLATLAAGPGPAPPSKSASTAAPTAVVTLKGTPVLLTEALKGSGLTFDAGPVADQVVIKGEDGGITPLLCDDASRALFTDKRLRGRRAELRGKRVAGLPYFQVVGFRVEEEGKLRTPEYYCEICSIGVRYPQACPCCQAEMMLRMKPERE